VDGLGLELGQPTDSIRDRTGSGSHLRALGGLRAGPNVRNTVPGAAYGAEYNLAARSVDGAAAAETGPVKKPFSRTRGSSAGSASNVSGYIPNAFGTGPIVTGYASNGSRIGSHTSGNVPNVSLLSVIRMLDLSHLKLKVACFTLLSLIGALSQAALLLVISEVVVAGVEGKRSIRPPIGPAFSPHNAIIVSLVALAFFFVTSILSTFIATSVSAQALTRTRIRVITGFFRASWSLQSTERLGHVQQLLTMNAGASAGVVGNFAGGLQSLLMVCALLGVALAVAPLAAGIVLVLGIVLLQMLRPLNLRSRRANRELSLTTRAMATQVTEYTRVSRDFRLFGVESRVIDRLSELIQETGRKVRFTSRLGSIAPLLYQTFALGIIIVGIVFLAHSGRTGLEKDGAVLILVLRGVTYGAGVQGAIQGLRFAQGLLEDLMFDLNRFQDDRFNPGECVPESFGVDFDSVEYTYDGLTLALDDISIHIPQGKIIGLLGPSGSGKTTISQILLGLRRPTSGRATIGGDDAGNIAKGDAHSTVALVPQEPVLLQGSIIDNIKFFRDFEESEVIEAAKSAHLHEDVLRMPDGYETLVGEGGGALSGGQKQRLAIARALIGSPKLIVLDEPTSAVDGRTEKLIRRTLSGLRGRVTVVIISHRIETTAQCDLLLVLSNGKIADYGERDDVLVGTAYRNIVLNLNEFAEEPIYPGQIPTVDQRSGRRR
jgi:ATP-binding cassette, subfamily B, bacterial